MRLCTIGNGAVMAVALFVLAGPAAAAEQLVSQNLGAGAYVASTSYSFYGPARAFDGDYGVDSRWNADGAPLQWIQADLLDSYDLSRVRLVAEQSTTAVRTVHQIWASDQPILSDRQNASLIYTFDGITVTGQVIDCILPTPVSARYVEVVTTDSPSWVAWREVQVFAVVPEPATAALVGLCALPAGLARRRR